MKVEVKMKAVTSTEAKGLLDRGATLVDIRERDEHARERIPGALNSPLSQMKPASFAEGGAILFHCKSGGRTSANLARLREAAPGCEVIVLEGGIDAWKAAGLPIATDSRQPIEIMRQVQITSGGLAAIGALAALLGPKWFAFMPLFIGSGLIFAGVTGTCGMAALLKRAPWNQSRRAPRTDGAL